jgi:NitT/TauT family transport system permease protein
VAAREDARRLAAAAVPRPSRPGALRHRVRIALPPVAAFVVLVGTWQLVVTALNVPHYLVPAPTAVFAAATTRWVDLWTAITTTFLAALVGLSLSIVVGVSAALVMSQSKVLERTFYPYAVILQTIPIVAIAPLVVIWLGAGTPAVIVISFLISLFPMISNSAAGLSSTDHNLVNMFELYNANWWQRIVKLKLPFALPYIMAGLRISSGLSIIGAIVGEFVGGIAGQRGGLGYVLTAAAIRLDMPYLFSAAFASALLGITIFIVVSFIQDLTLRHWHESAVAREA